MSFFGISGCGAGEIESIPLYYDAVLEVGSYEEFDLNQGCPIIPEPKIEFEHGVGDFYCSFRTSETPKEEEIICKWIVIDCPLLPKQKEHIWLESTNKIEKSSYKETYFTTFIARNGSKNKNKFFFKFKKLEKGEPYPPGKYKIEIYEGSVKILDRFFIVKDLSVIKIGKKEKIKGVETLIEEKSSEFLKGEKDITAGWKCVNHQEGVAEIKWIVIESEDETNYPASKVIYEDKKKKKKFTVLSSDLKDTELPIGSYCVQFFLTEKKKPKLLAEKNFYIVNEKTKISINLSAITKKNKKYTSEDFTFPDKIRSIKAVVTTNKIFKPGTITFLVYEMLNTGKKLIHTYKDERETETKTSSFELKKKGGFFFSHYKIDVFLLTIDKKRIDLISQHFVVGLTSKSSIGTLVKGSRILDPRYEFPKQTEKIFGVCISNVHFFPGDIFTEIWTIIKNNDKSRTDVQNDQVIGNYFSKIRKNSNIFYFVLNVDDIDKKIKGFKKNGFPPGEYKVELKVHNILLDEIYFQVNEQIRYLSTKPSEKTITQWKNTLNGREEKK